MVERRKLYIFTSLQFFSSLVLISKISMFDPNVCIYPDISLQNLTIIYRSFNHINEIFQLLNEMKNAILKCCIYFLHRLFL